MGEVERRDRCNMMAAIELAELGRGATSPNPMVGALIVKDGRVVGRGHHARWGGPHAEVNALAEAGDEARGATLYVTLEPCCVWGKTPPCTRAIMDAGIGRVVAATLDPNPEVSGRGIEELRAAGVEVSCGVCEHEARELNAAYIKFRDVGLPLVTLKLALSVDGRIAGGAGSDRWVSCEASREAVHRMRSRADGVMVGVGTVLADDPMLNDRRERADRQPRRIVIDTDLRTPQESALVRSANGVPTIVVTSVAAPKERERALADAGVRVIRCAAGDGGLDLRAALAAVAQEGVLNVLCEGGATLATSLLSGGFVDRVALFVAPKLFGAQGLSATGDLGPLGVELSEPRWSPSGDDVLLEAVVTRAAQDSPDGSEERREETIVHGIDRGEGHR